MITLKRIVEQWLDCKSSAVAFIHVCCGAGADVREEARVASDDARPQRDDDYGVLVAG